MKTAKPLLLLLALCAVTVIDVVSGLNLNLFGYGREPLLFALGAVGVASVLYCLAGAWLGMITLVLCCVWLMLYPAKNGFDVVLSPTLLVGVMVWLWQKYMTKNED